MHEHDRRPYGNYIIEGCVGVIHREFEKTWLADPNREPREQSHGNLLLLANFLELGPTRYLPANDPTAEDVANFCNAVAEILSAIPSDEMQLVNALEADKLHRFPFGAFAGYSYRSKFAAFEKFLRHRGRMLRTNSA